MPKLQTIEVPVAGMDCTECTQHVQKAVKALPGVESVNVLLSSEKAVITMDPEQVGMPAIRKAVEGAGYKVPEVAEELGIGEATVKTHLHRLFAKTETTRQAELVKLVAAFSNPLVN